MLTKKIGLALVLASIGVLAACGDDKTDTSGSGASGSAASSSSMMSSSVGGGMGGMGGEGGMGGMGGMGGGGGSSATCSQEMFAKYKEAGFVAVNNKIAEKTKMVSEMNPSPIGDSFKMAKTFTDPAKTMHFKDSLASFLIQAYGGPKGYKGPPMEEVHKGMKITMEQYNNFITQVVVPSLQEVGVEAKDISDCFAPVVTDPAFVNSIVGQ